MKGQCNCKGHTVDVATFSEGIIIAKALRYSTRCRGISQFYLHTQLPTRLSTNGMNHIRLCLPSQSWSSFTEPRRD